MKKKKGDYWENKIFKIPNLVYNIFPENAATNHEHFRLSPSWFDMNYTVDTVSCGLYRLRFAELSALCFKLSKRVITGERPEV